MVTHNSSDAWYKKLHEMIDLQQQQQIWMSERKVCISYHGNHQTVCEERAWKLLPLLVPGRSFLWHHVGLNATKSVFGVSKKVRITPACSASETS